MHGEQENSISNTR